MEERRNLVDGVYSVANMLKLIGTFDPTAITTAIDKNTTAITTAIDKNTTAIEVKNDRLLLGIQVIFIFLFVLILILVLIFLSRTGISDLAQTSEAIATLQQTPMYSQCCQALAGNSELLERFEEMFQPSLDLTSQEACDAYSLRIHQLYADIVRYLINTPRSS